MVKGIGRDFILKLGWISGWITLVALAGESSITFSATAEISVQSAPCFDLVAGQGAYVTWMNSKHLARVLALEEETHPPWIAWGSDRFEKMIKGLWEDVPVQGLVALRGNQVVGYAVYKLHPRYYEVVKTVVSPEWVRKGIGTSLVWDYLKRIGTRSGSVVRRYAVAHVRESDQAGQWFLHGLGFEAIHTSHDYFPETGEDAYHFIYRPE